MASPSSTPQTIRVRRPIRSHLIHGGWTIITFYKMLDGQPPGNYIAGTLFAISIAVALRVLTMPNYIELTGTKLTVNGDLYFSSTIEITDIEEIQIEASPFGSSKIILKKRKDVIKFNYWNVDTKDFTTLLQQLNVPIK